MSARGVKGRRVKWHGEEWIIAEVRGDFLNLRRELRGRARVGGRRRAARARQVRAGQLHGKAEMKTEAKTIWTYSRLSLSGNPRRQMGTVAVKGKINA